MGDFEEIIFLILGLMLLGAFIVPWVNLFRINGTHKRIEGLKDKIRALEEALAGDGGVLISKQVRAEAQPVVEKVDVVADVSEGETEEWDDFDHGVVKETGVGVVPVSEPSSKDGFKVSDFGFEKNLATKLPVWIGAVCLICAAFFLVKYSIDSGWLSAGVRVALGGLFGIILIGVGQWLFARDGIANNVRMSQGLVGAGIVSLYGSVYASIELYQFLSPTIGFICMAAVTAFAVVLSLRHGQAIAVFGLVGGLVTPALIGADDPNAVALFGYLFFLFVGLFFVLARKGWWSLAIASVVGVFLWSAFWFVIAFDDADALVLVVFAVAVTGAVLAMTGRMIAADGVAVSDRIPVHGLNFTAILGGVLTIVWLSFEIRLTLFDWSMLGLLSMALFGLSYFKPAIYQRPLCVKLAASLVLYYVWVQGVALLEAVLVMAGMTAIYVIGGALMMREVRDPRFWAGLQVATALALFLIGFYSFDLPAGFEASFGMFWGIASLILAGLAVFQASDIRAKYTANDRIREHLVAIYALAASAFIALGVAIELPWEYVPLAIAAQVAATAWVFSRSQIAFLKIVMVILTGVFVALQYEQIGLFAELIMNGLEGGKISSYRMERLIVLDSPFLKLGVPALLIGLAFSIYRRVEGTDQRLMHVLFGGAMILALGCIYYLVRMVFGDFDPAAVLSRAEFIERGFVTMLFAGLGVALFYGHGRLGFAAARLWGIGLFHLAMVRFVWFDLLADNPVWDEMQNVGDWLLLNGVTLSYGLGGAMAAWAVYQKDVMFEKLQLRIIYRVIGFTALFAFVTFTVRHFYVGAFLTQGDASLIEMYSYSVVWLVTGLALLSAGIKWSNKSARMGSLGFMILTVLKVFLFDAAELEGLFRVFSFLGLGVSLIGLSYFYTKFVFKNISEVVET